MNELLALILAVSSWSAPQPRHSYGLLVIYGNQQLVEANADFRGYDLGPVPERCGLSAISPAHLGQLAWVRVPGKAWVGPCLIVDSVARKDAYESIYVRREVAEISRATAAVLGFDNGGRMGYLWLGPCPPGRGAVWEPAEAYRPPLAWDYPPYEAHPSFWPYPAQKRPRECAAERVVSHDPL